MKGKAVATRFQGRPSPIVLTIGHSTRTLEEFIGLLQAHAVSRVVDVRTVPRSRHNPQFNKDSLPDSLKKAGLGYVHMPGLGGLRPKRPTWAGETHPFGFYRALAFRCSAHASSIEAERASIRTCNGPAVRPALPNDKEVPRGFRISYWNHLHTRGREVPQISWRQRNCASLQSGDLL